MFNVRDSSRVAFNDQIGGRLPNYLQGHEGGSSFTGRWLSSLETGGRPQRRSRPRPSTRSGSRLQQQCYLTYLTMIDDKNLIYNGCNYPRVSHPRTKKHSPSFRIFYGQITFSSCFFLSQSHGSTAM